jgi:hypothetical protein
MNAARLRKIPWWCVQVTYASAWRRMYIRARSRKEACRRALCRCPKDRAVYLWSADKVYNQKAARLMVSEYGA